MANTESHELDVLDRGVHCAGCEARIESVLARVPGGAEVKADHRTQKVRLILDPDDVSIQELIERLESLGFRTA